MESRDSFRCTYGSWECEVGGLDVDFSRVVADLGANVPALLHFLHEARGAVVADLQAALEIARTSAAIRGDGFEGFFDERVGAGVEGRVVAGARNVLGAEFHAVARGELGFERRDDGLDLGVVDEGGLKTLEAA